MRHNAAQQSNTGLAYTYSPVTIQKILVCIIMQCNILTLSLLFNTGIRTADPDSLVTIRKMHQHAEYKRTALLLPGENVPQHLQSPITVTPYAQETLCNNQLAHIPWFNNQLLGSATRTTTHRWHSNAITSKMIQQSTCLADNHNDIGIHWNKHTTWSNQGTTPTSANYNFVELDTYMHIQWAHIIWDSTINWQPARSVPLQQSYSVPDRLAVFHSSLLK